ncbi:MAG: ssuC 2 [Polyangiaceae bacterium]|jgi:sulfonate transport system permease protein|nr:ssuC 2 [Polyangiaceae bacterium]
MKTRGLIVPAVVLVVWELAARAGLLPPNWLPAPSTVAQTLGELARTGELLEHVLSTLTRLLLGFSLGAALGTLLGVSCGRSERLRSLLDPSLQALRSIPSLAWVPLFLLWLGIQETSKVALIAVGAFFPVYLNLLSGILAIDRRLVEVGVMNGYRGWALSRHVLVPAALPAYLTGLRSGLGLAWMFVVAAELLGASRGLGYLMVDGQSTSRIELVLAAIFAFALLGKVSDRLLQALEVKLQPWRAT